MKLLELWPSPFIILPCREHVYTWSNKCQGHTKLKLQKAAHRSVWQGGIFKLTNIDLCNWASPRWKYTSWDSQIHVVERNVCICWRLLPNDSVHCRNESQWSFSDLNVLLSICNADGMVGSLVVFSPIMDFFHISSPSERNSHDLKCMWSCFLTSMKNIFGPIGGSKGRQGRAPHWGSKFFNFHAVLGKKFAK